MGRLLLLGSCPVDFDKSSPRTNEGYRNMVKGYRNKGINISLFLSQVKIEDKSSSPHTGTRDP